LQTASQFLLDATKKKEYDAYLSNITLVAKNEMERSSRMQEERKRMADELLKRENEYTQFKEQDNVKRQKHVMRDFKAKAKRRVEEMQAQKDQEARERAELLGKQTIDKEKRGRYMTLI